VISIVHPRRIPEYGLGRNPVEVVRLAHQRLNIEDVNIATQGLSHGTPASYDCA
jgi:hypothetical protein